ncbi:MAG: hypothetical protein HN350_18575 [Phycisphaerales bacterium]|nr:hypothetical protein [Phycisphaerales bacterium]
MERLKIIVTAGATREYIDSVRFISNASSGLMGCQVAAIASQEHDVTLLLGAAGPPASIVDRLGDVEIVTFTSVTSLRVQLTERFDGCDVLVMSAAVGDFRPAEPIDGKIPRRGGAVTLRLEPTEDILAGLASGKRSDQMIVAFAVEDGPRELIEPKALGEMKAKGASCVILNTPAAMGSDESEACILTADGMKLPWANRPKEALAREIVDLLGTL